MGQIGIAAIRELVRSLNYFVTLHAAEELEDDALTILDFENIVLSGTIVVTQRDRKTRESKFLIRGQTLGGDQAETVVKVGSGGGLVVITVYVT